MRIIPGRTSRKSWTIRIRFPPSSSRFRRPIGSTSGGTYTGRRLLGALTVNYTDEAFWSDVLTSEFHGFTDSFTMVNGSFGVRWDDGRITTTIKSTNLFNQTIQQHVFGDLLKRSVTAEVRFDF